MSYLLSESSPCQTVINIVNNWSSSEGKVGEGDVGHRLAVVRCLAHRLVLVCVTPLLFQIGIVK